MRFICYSKSWQHFETFAPENQFCPTLEDKKEDEVIDQTTSVTEKVNVEHENKVNLT